MFEKFFSGMANKDLFQLLSDMTGALEDLAEAFKLAPMIFYIAGLVLAAVIGVFGYKLIKLITAVVAGVIGYYFVGAELYFLLTDLFKLKDLPEWAVYIPAAVFGLLFFALAFKKFSYTFYTAMGLIGFAVTYFYTANALLSIGGAFLLALICMYVVRFSFVILTSVFAGFAGVALLSAVLPDLNILRLSYDNLAAVGIAAGISLLFVIIQLIITRRDGEAAEAPRYIKRRGEKKSKKHTSGRLVRRRIRRDL